MKTTQRSFVVAYKSGRREPKVGTKSIWGDTDFKALAREAEDYASHLFSLSGAPSAPDVGDDVWPDPMNGASTSEHATNLGVVRPAMLSAAEADLVTQDRANRPSADNVESESGPTSRPQATSIGATRNRTKPASGRPIPSISMSALGDQGAQSRKAINPISLDEVGALDAENKRLKRMLVEQLRAQNLQLDNMLARFNVT
ncbi:hypothetical protein G6K86_30770 [Agrobacterium rhizogenes]|nr:hypothetical protein [Rhizobium rhizogenes]